VSFNCKVDSKGGELLGTPNASGEDNQQASPKSNFWEASETRAESL